MTPAMLHNRDDTHYHVSAISKGAWFDLLTSNAHVIGERSQKQSRVLRELCTCEHVLTVSQK
jgi:hypothetical protein